MVSTAERNTPQSPQVVSPAHRQHIARGRYLVTIAGCNDCHTAGYVEAGGKVPEKDWLTGTPLGFRGPWGTTYATNLRLYMHSLAEDQWVTVSHTMQPRPPMPWFNLHAMTERNLRAIGVSRGWRHGLVPDEYPPALFAGYQCGSPASDGE